MKNAVYIFLYQVEEQYSLEMVDELLAEVAPAAVSIPLLAITITVS